MLDMDIRKSLWAVKDEVAVSEETMAFEEICERVKADQTWLDSEHTVAHFREMWRSELFPPTPSGPAGAAGDEKRILDECDERWRANVANHEPPEWPADTMAALEDVLKRAEQELL